MIGAFLNAREANQCVHLKTLLAHRRRMHTAVANIIRVDDVCDNMPGDLAAS